MLDFRYKLKVEDILSNIYTDDNSTGKAISIYYLYYVALSIFSEQIKVVFKDASIRLLGFLELRRLEAKRTYILSLLILPYDEVLINSTYKVHKDI